MSYVIAIWAAMLQPAALQPEFVQMFQAAEYRYTGGRYNGAPFRYRLFVPESSDPDERFPLIVWLHGRGERGEDNAYQLRWLEELLMPPPWRRDRFPFFVLVVQCPEENSYWRRHGPENAPDDMFNVVAAILDETLRTQPVDPDRVYLSGISSGGSGCWRMAMAYPAHFAAIAPLGSRGTRDKELRKLRDIPIWTFHSTEDTSIPVQPVRNTVAILDRMGGRARLTEIASTEHNCWSAAYGDYRSLDWLLAQRRGAPIWQWWQVLLQAAVLALIGGVIWSIVKLRGRIAVLAGFLTTFRRNRPSSIR